MFGMPSKDFWEEDPQLYWAYRTFYLKKIEVEQKQQTEFMKYNVWLNGNANYMATSISLNNAFSKSKREYPKFDDFFGKDKGNIKNKKEINHIVQEEYNSWARF